MNCFESEVPMNSFTFLIVCLSWLFLVLGTQQSQNSHTQILLQLRKQLEYPKPLEPWNNYNGSLCNSISSSQITVKCEGNFVTELKILGEISSKVTNFNGFVIPNLTLSESFSIDSFVTTLTRLSSLRVLSLVSLGIWGSLPDKIHRLHMLEFLDLSSNFLYGSIPPKISSMVKLQTLTLDENFLNNTIPDWFDSLSNLTILSLKNNQLKGLVPSSICRIKTLTKIALSHNEISGKLPDGLSDLTNLQVLDLGENRIDSELPLMPRQLITVLLENNSLSGEIPLQFGELSQLQHLDLSFNFLQGTLDASLFSLLFINYLNLASNMLTGSLPERLTCSGALEFVDISINRLTGKLPSCLSSMTDKRVVKFDMNCLSTDPLHQHEGSFCKENHIKGKKSVWVLMGVIGGFLIVMGLLVFGFLVLFRIYYSRGTSRHRRLPKAVQDYSSSGFSSEMLANARFISQAAMLGSQGVPLCRIFYIEELKEATNNFDQSALMGNGSIGKLYKGKLENGTSVAIRCLALLKRYSIRNLKLRLDLLSKVRHPHLVCLLGYCIESDERDDSSVKRFFVIYEYMPNGNLHTHISESIQEKALRWSERLSVLIGIAKAVNFLHSGMNPGFFNNYLKTKSILLDEHGIAKLSDYGLSVITEEINKFGSKRENSNSDSTAKDDVYSFGFILLETLLGSTTTERGEAVLLNEMATFDSRNARRRQIIDPTVLATCCEESLSIVISITNKCISRDLSTRPSFEDVLWNLQYAAQVEDGDQIQM